MDTFSGYTKVDTDDGVKTLKVPAQIVACKACGSHDVIKFGFYNNTQKFRCNVCGLKFSDNNALPDMQTPVDQVGVAIGMYYEGQSLNSVCRLLEQIYHSYPSDSTVYRWITRFTKQALKQEQDYHPKVGDEWVMDETMVDVVGGDASYKGRGKAFNKYWLIDVIDAKTRYLLATKLSTTRGIRDIKEVLLQASKNAGGIVPKRILADGLAGYDDGVEQAFGADSKRILGNPFDTENSTNLIERFHGSLKQRTKVMRALKDYKTARLIMDGWLFYYNFLRPHESLDGKTPAQESGIKYPCANWQEVIAKKKVITPAKVSATSTLIIPDIKSIPYTRFTPPPEVSEPYQRAAGYSYGLTSRKPKKRVKRPTFKTKKPVATMAQFYSIRRKKER